MFAPRGWDTHVVTGMHTVQLKGAHVGVSPNLK